MNLVSSSLKCVALALVCDFKSIGNPLWIWAASANIYIKGNRSITAICRCCCYISRFFTLFTLLIGHCEKTKRYNILDSHWITYTFAVTDECHALAAAIDQIYTGLPILLQSHTSAMYLLLLLTRFTLDYLYFCSHTQVPRTCCCCPDSHWIAYTFAVTHECHALAVAAAADQIHTILPILLPSHTSATHLLLLLTRFTLDYLYFCRHTQVPHTCCCCWPDLH